MRIGELAELALCTVETVRHYEKEGLLPPPSRTQTNYRMYNQEHLAQLRFIRNCRALGMSHDEIRQLLALLMRKGNDCDGVRQLIDEHIVHVDVRIAELLELKKQLNALSLQCEHQPSLETCGILQGLVSMGVEESKPAHAGRAHLRHV